jgi:hypothetical protein
MIWIYILQSEKKKGGLSVIKKLNFSGDVIWREVCLTGGESKEV